MSATVHEERFSRDASNVSCAAKLHQVEIRARRNCMRRTPRKNATGKRKPGKAGLVDIVRSVHFYRFARHVQLITSLQFINLLGKLPWQVT
jgi:hypothetical protein